jgi:hypothetical protein
MDDVVLRLLSCSQTSELRSRRQKLFSLVASPLQQPKLVISSCLMALAFFLDSKATRYNREREELAAKELNNQ